MPLLGSKDEPVCACSLIPWHTPAFEVRPRHLGLGIGISLFSCRKPPLCGFLPVIRSAYAKAIPQAQPPLRLDISAFCHLPQRDRYNWLRSFAIQFQVADGFLSVDFVLPTYCCGSLPGPNTITAANRSVAWQA